MDKLKKLFAVSAVSVAAVAAAPSVFAADGTDYIGQITAAISLDGVNGGIVAAATAIIGVLCVVMGSKFVMRMFSR